MPGVGLSLFLESAGERLVPVAHAEPRWIRLHPGPSQRAGLSVFMDLASTSLEETPLSSDDTLTIQSRDLQLGFSQEQLFEGQKLWYLLLEKLKSQSITKEVSKH